MPIMTITLLILATLLLFIGVPIAVALGLSSVIVMVFFQPVPNMQIIPQLFSEAATSFVMLAVPLFILTGKLMEKGSMGKNLIDFVNSIVGWANGGLGSVNILGSMIFGGISGSSLADTATFGTILVPLMEDDGYPKGYASAVTLSSSCLSVIIPPSILIVLAAASTQQSVARALAGGIVPGILITFLLMLMNYYYSKKNNYGTKAEFSIKEVFNMFKKTWTALITPIIILGIIFTGIVTPTEAAAVAVLYILIIDGVFLRKLGMYDIIDSFKQTAVLTSTILFIVTSGAIANYIIAYEQIPSILGDLFLKIPGGEWSFMLVMTIMWVIIGMILDAGPAIIIFIPLFLPIATKLGVDLIHFLMTAVMGLGLGLTTPPYGVCLFSLSSVCNISIGKLANNSRPFYILLFFALFLVAFFPQLVLFLPNIFGL